MILLIFFFKNYLHINDIFNNSFHDRVRIHADENVFIKIHVRFHHFHEQAKKHFLHKFNILRYPLNFFNILPILTQNPEYLWSNKTGCLSIEKRFIEMKKRHYVWIFQWILVNTCAMRESGMELLKYASLHIENS